MPGAPDAGQEGDNGQTAYLAVKLLRTVVDKIGCSGKIRYSEVQDDCSIKRRVLLSEQLKHVWQSCLRSGEVIVSLLHASNKIQKMLTVHGCPLLPLQEGSERMDWLRLRSRFLGNWRNIQNVLRYMQKKCPHLRLETLDPNVGEVIVDRVDVQRSHMLTVASLTQCMALLLAQRITLEDLLLFQSPTDHVDQPQDANNSADHPRLRHRRRGNRNNNQRDKQPPSLQLQPKLDRLNSTRRVTCVYDTTTTEDDAGTPTTAAAGATATVGQNPDGDTSTGGAGVTLSAKTLVAILQHLNNIRSLLMSTAPDGADGKQPTDTPPCKQQSPPLFQPPPSQFSLQPPQMQCLSQPSIPPALLPLFQLQQLQQSQRQTEEEKQQNRVCNGGRKLQKAHRSRVAQPQKPPSDCESGSAGLTASAGDSDESEETASLSIESLVKMRGRGSTKSALKGAKGRLTSTSANRPQPTSPTCHQLHRQPKQRPHQRLRLLDAQDNKNDSGSDSGPRNSDQDADGGGDNGSRSNSRMAARRNRRRKPPSPMGVEPAAAAAAAVSAPPEPVTGRRRRHQPAASGKKLGNSAAGDTAATVHAPAGVAIISDNSRGDARLHGIPTVTFPMTPPAPTAAVTVQEVNKNVGAQTLTKSTIQDLIIRLQSVLGDSNI